MRQVLSILPSLTKRGFILVSNKFKYVASTSRLLHNATNVGSLGSPKLRAGYCVYRYPAQYNSQGLYKARIIGMKPGDVMSTY